MKILKNKAEIKLSSEDVAAAIEMFLNVNSTRISKEDVKVLKITKTRSTNYFLIAEFK
jgi:hypothetical protein